MSKPEKQSGNEQQAWEEGTLADSLRRMPERKESFTSVSGIPLERVYLPENADCEAYQEKLGFPGKFPFTRGVQPTMYRSRLWTVRQYAGFGTAAQSNQRYRYLLQQGAKGLSVAFDLPTQIGYDSDDPIATGEIGRVGVAIDTLADMETLLEGIPLDEVSTSMTINSTAPILLAMYIAVAEKRGIALEKLSGTLQNDILKEYAARGTYRFPPRPSLRLIRDVFAYCTRSMPRYNTISISGYHIREAGSTAAQEIGFTLAHGICYIETALASGLDIDEFAPRLAFFFAAHSELFEEVAKFRAARRLYAKIMRDRFGAKNDRSCMLRFHTQTGGVTLTAQQPENNIVRVTMQALAAVLGGTQSLHTNAMDEALALPSEEAVRTAINTQHILANETGVADTVDPLGGSYFVERLTDQLQEEAEQIIKEIDEMGGVVIALEQGWIQGRIEQSAYTFGQAVESESRIIVGVNKYQTEEEAKVELFSVPPEVAQEQLEKLKQTRQDRDAARVATALDEIERVARSDENLMPPLLEAVRAYASVGEICSRLAKVFGEHSESFA